MGSTKPICAIGMISGTSADAIDVAAITTDGQSLVETGPTLAIPLNPDLREAILNMAATFDGAQFEQRASWQPLSQMVTTAHIEALAQFLRHYPDIKLDLIGFHGQTVWHDPAHGRTLQLGDPQRLADHIDCPVVGDLRLNDMRAGGQGAPILPAYHQALCSNLALPVAILNIGGVSNVTWVGEGELLAFDTGPGNAIVDDWVARHDAGAMDTGGALAIQGTVEQTRLDPALRHPYFSERPPKSLDRNSFEVDVAGLELANGAATLSEFTVQSIAQAQSWFPSPVQRWLVAGGGRHNRYLMAGLRQQLGCSVEPIDSIEFNGQRLNGDMLEAQGMGYLAVRSAAELPLTFPGTTGVDHPCLGGMLYQPKFR